MTNDNLQISIRQIIFDIAEIRRKQVIELLAALANIGIDDITRALIATQSMEKFNILHQEETQTLATLAQFLEKAENSSS